MADWVWVESPGTSLTLEPRVIASKFGDGYEQRAPDGLNNSLQTWSLSFNDVDDEIAADMMAFLGAANGVTAFSYVPLWSTVAIRVKCARWTRTQGQKPGMSSISATFEQVPEP